MRIGRKALASMLILVLIAIITLEVYTHTYVPHLSVTRKEDVATYMPYINGTSTFHRTFRTCSVDWLVAWHFRKPTPSLNSFYIYLFKVNKSGSFLTQDLEVMLQEIRTTSRGVYHANAVIASLDQVFYQSNYTVARIQYDIGYVDTYNVNFSLLVKVYAKTLVGYLPIEDIRIPINVTMIYRP